MKNNEVVCVREIGMVGLQDRNTSRGEKQDKMKKKYRPSLKVNRRALALI